MTPEEAKEITSIVARNLEKGFGFQKEGQNIVGPCLICENEEKSLWYYPEKDYFHCFNCEVGGPRSEYIVILKIEYENDERK